ncbi:MAG: ion transporter [Nitrosopumilus sp.]|nr:ion transporter [Nitrosopumilus sp.]
MERTTLQKKLYQVIFGTETPAGRTFDLILLVLILASVIVVILESVIELRALYAQWFLIIEWVFTIVFTVEYVLRIYSSPNPKRYILSFFGIVDFLAILPTYLSLLFGGIQYLLLIRILRLLRIFRILKLVHFVENAELLGKALKNSFHKIIVFISTVLTFVIIVGTLMYVIEGEENGYTSIPKSIYWTIVTVTTVGYGDITPLSNFGKLLASLVMLTGYAIIAVPTGIVTVELSKTVAEANKKIRCINCSNLMAPEDNFCSNCGARAKVQ